MKTINHSQIEDTFRNLLSKTGKKTFSANDALDIFEEFFFTFDIKNFPKDTDNDMALYQCGVYDWGDGEKFEVDFTRQLSFEEDSEYEGMKQLHFTIYYDKKLASKDDAYNIWFDSNKGKKEWLNSIKASTGFKKVKDIKTNIFEIKYEDV
ncbi:hypothetical protein GF357_04650 [Candidatus Dojkabacteria bacterium]|nr:hypothetical protein [Candidatus Dojkabacteria bacterium]